MVVLLVPLCVWAAPVYGGGAEQQDEIMSHINRILERTGIRDVVIDSVAGTIAPAEDDTGDIGGAIGACLHELTRPEHAPVILALQERIGTFLPGTIADSANAMLSFMCAAGSLEETTARVLQTDGAGALVCMGFLLPAIILLGIALLLLPLGIPTIALLSLTVLLFAMYVSCIASL